MEHLLYLEICDRVRAMKPLVDWNEIKEGDIYVIPKILDYGRRVIKVKSKCGEYITCEITEQGKGTEYFKSIYRSEVSAHLIVKPFKIIRPKSDK